MSTRAGALVLALATPLSALAGADRAAAAAPLVRPSSWSARAGRVPAARTAQRADSTASLARLPSGAPRSPGRAPLPVPPPAAEADGAGGLSSRAGEADEAGGLASPAGEADPLVTNGLGSPSCRSTSIEPVLTQAARRDCETSGFIGSAAPTGDYGIDVHIDTGLLGLSSGGLLSVVQDLVVTPVWMAIVWIIHALVVMLEWSFSLDLIAGSAGSLRADLLREQAGVTAPWLPLVLAAAAVLIAYRGLVRRRVADTLGEALAMAVMMAGGLWLTLDPAGTVGAVSRWADDAGLGTLAVAAQGSPAAPERALGISMSALFTSAVEAPWCYLEFGDVRWCREPGQLDPQLRSTGLKIAARELREAGCGGAQACTGAGRGAGEGRAAGALQASARLLREAHSNGALFLALPPNGPARNSINDEWSLLRALCGSEEATNCRGPTAAQAQFRTNGGTWSRVGGLLLIAIGVLGLIVLLGYIAVRLLMAAVMSLLYLLLAPAAVLAPAFGEPGRELFRAWAARLFGATVAKLVYAFLLGVLLTLMSLLGTLSGIGWWAQWLLMSAFWWSAFLHRHQLRSLARGPIHRPAASSRRPLGNRLAHTYVAERARRHSRSRSGHAPGFPGGEEAFPTMPERRTQPGPQGVPRAGGAGGDAPGGPGETGREAPNAYGGEAAQAQFARIEEALSAARLHGDRRRVALLEARRTRVATTLVPEPAGPPAGARGGPPADRRESPAPDVTGLSPTFLALQGQLPPRGARNARGERRDYAALAPLAGIASTRYERLGPREARAARLEVDRELAARRAAGPTGEELWQDVKAYSDGRKRQLGIGRP